MPYAASDAGSDTTKGSTHSSAIMTISEPWEYRHTPLSRMGTPDDRQDTPVSRTEPCTNRAGTPGSDNTVRPSSRNQVIPYQNAPGPLTASSNTSQAASRDQITPYQHAPLQSSYEGSRLPPLLEYVESTDSAIQRAAEERARQNRRRSQDFTTRRPSHIENRQSGERRSSRDWIAPIIALGAAAVLANIPRRDSNTSQSSEHDRDDADRHPPEYHAPTYDSDDDDYDNDYKPSRSRKSRGSRDYDHDKGRRNSGR